MACHLRYEWDALSGGARFVAGVDEAGRGPLAGPVVAAAVVLPHGFSHRRLNDSKALTPSVRAEIFEEITARGDIQWAVASAEVQEIDRINILRATHQAMRRAVSALAPAPDHVLIDGLPVHPFPFRQTAIVKGDAQSYSIAAASVIAKVWRDRFMIDLHQAFPLYGFADHKGYATRDHLDAITRHGPCVHHRRTFLRAREETPELAFE